MTYNLKCFDNSRTYEGFVQYGLETCFNLFLLFGKVALQKEKSHPIHKC